MMRRNPAWHTATALVLVLLSLGVLAGAENASAPAAKPAPREPVHSVTIPTAAESRAPAERRQYTTETVKGKVVWLAEGLSRLYGVVTEVAAAENTVALETPEGRLLPIVPDTRGHAFAVDAELRSTELELLVRRYEGVPMIQVIRVRQPKPDGLYEIDYWCDVCAIPMYILKPCECCQGPTRLRGRLVEAGVVRD